MIRQPKIPESVELKYPWMREFLEREKRIFKEQERTLKNFTMRKHGLLEGVAIRLLKRMGFKHDEIHVELRFYRGIYSSHVDVCGISPAKRVAIEVGYGYGSDWLKTLKKEYGFDEAYRLTYGFNLRE